jgi:glycosyltransferase involved in cell wall biosynthesis
MESTKYGSLEHYLLELSKFCNQRGYKTVLQYDERPASEEYVKDLEANQVKTIITKSVAINPFRSMLNIVKLIRSVKPEIINTHFVDKHILLLVPVIARMSGVKKTVHMQHSLGHYNRSSSIKLLMFGIAYRMYDCVLGVSSAVSEDILCTGVDSKKVFVQYLGLFGKREKSEQLRIQLRKEFGIPEDAVVFECIAFDTPFKGLDILLDALSKVVRNHSNIHLIVVGVDPSQSKLPKQAADLGLFEHVHWAGIRDEGWKLLNAADVYVQPSRFGEGLSLAIMEALAVKLPVIATRTAGNPEAVIDGETGYLCEPGDVNGLVNAFERSLVDQANWKMIGEGGYKRYQHMFRGSKSIEALAENHYSLKV